MPQRDLFWRKGRDWAVRRGPWKLVGGNRDGVMLFNLDDDIGERKNLALQRPDLVAELTAAYEEWARNVPGESRDPPV